MAIAVARPETARKPHFSFPFRELAITATDTAKTVFTSKPAKAAGVATIALLDIPLLGLIGRETGFYDRVEQESTRMKLEKNKAELNRQMMQIPIVDLRESSDTKAINIFEPAVQKPAA